MLRITYEPDDSNCGPILTGPGPKGQSTDRPVMKTEYETLRNANALSADLDRAVRSTLGYTIHAKVPWKGSELDALRATAQDLPEWQE